MNHKLWTRVDGEPFLENPVLGIINRPTRKRKNRKGSGMARRSYGARHMAWVRSFKKNKGRRRGRKMGARRARRNPPNPRRGYHSRSRFTYKRRRGRRNPPGAVRVLGMTMPPLQPVLYGTLGFALPPVIEGFASQWLPIDFATSTLGKYVVKIGAVLGLTWAAKTMLGSNEAKAVAVGGGMYVAVSAVKDFMPGVIPGLGTYVPVSRQLGSYVPVAGRVVQPSYLAGMGGGVGRGLAAARFARMR